MTLLLCIGLLLFLAVSLVLGLNTAYIPGPLDEATRLETAQAQTATYAGTSFDLGPVNLGAGPGIGQPMAAVVKITAVDHTTGDETYTFTLMDSPDGTTWTVIGPSVESHVVGKIAIPGFRSQRYVAVRAVLAGTTPIITYDAWLTTQGFPRT